MYSITDKSKLLGYIWSSRCNKRTVCRGQWKAYSSITRESGK